MTDVPTPNEYDRLRKALETLAIELDRAATDRQAWADHPEIGGRKPHFQAHLRGKRYGYSHAAQLIRSALTPTASGLGSGEGGSSGAESAAVGSLPALPEAPLSDGWRDISTATMDTMTRIVVAVQNFDSYGHPRPSLRIEIVTHRGSGIGKIPMTSPDAWVGLMDLGQSPRSQILYWRPLPAPPSNPHLGGTDQ